MAVTRALIGVEDVNYGSGTFSRTNSTGGTTTATKVPSGITVFNVKDYGAVGDGVTDDAANIQLAIDAAGSIGTVFFPDATYAIGTSLTLSGTDVLLLGQATIQALVALGAGGKMCVVSGTGITIRDLTFDQANLTTGVSIEITTATHTRLENLTSKNVQSAFIRFNGACIYTSVVDCYHNSAGYGILVNDTNGATDLVIDNCTFLHPGSGAIGDGIEINCPTNGFSNFSITNNRIKNSFGNASNAGIGIGVANVSNGIISGNVISDTQNDAIHIEDGSTNIAITGNTITGCVTSATNSTGAIAITNLVTETTVTGNTINNTVNRAAIASTAVTNGELNARLVISDNVIRGTNTFAVSLESTKDSLLDGNIISNANTSNTGSTVNIRLTKFGTDNCSTITISNNTVLDGTNSARSLGIEVASSATGIRVIDNDFSGCTPTKPSIVSTNGVVLAGNTPEDSQTLTGPGAVDTIFAITKIATTGIDALTLVDGTEGQRKTLVMSATGGAGTLTPTNLGNGTTITFNAIGDSANLIFMNGAWNMVGGTATLA